MASAADHRPQLEREALRLVATGALLILGCAALGAWAAASIVIHLTTPKERT